MADLRRFGVAILIVSSLAACAGESATEPKEDVPTEGWAALTVTTTGTDLDPDGYRYVVDGAAGVRIGIDTMVYVRTSVGVHTFGLTDLLSNCEPDYGTTPVEAAVVGGDTVDVSLGVTCGSLVSLSNRILWLHDWDILVADPDLTETDTVIDIESNATWGLDVSPDGKWLTWTEATGEELRGEVRIATFAGDSARTIASSPAVDQEGVWMADGRLAFVSDRGGTTGIWVTSIGADGTPELLIEDAHHPDVSPDGSRIVFSRVRNGSFDIWVADADGTDAVALTADDVDQNEPTWSPDGTRILFVADSDPGEGENWDLWVMDADGSNKQRLTNDEAPEVNPSWSPDGSRIVFAFRELFGTEWEIHRIASDGSDRGVFVAAYLEQNRTPFWIW